MEITATTQVLNRLSKARFFASAALRLRMTGYDLGYFKFWNSLTLPSKRTRSE